MATKLMYTPLETVFRDTMQREGNIVTAYTSGEEFKAFFRRNSDGNNIEDRITLYYYVTAPIAQGSIITYRKKQYIILNQETEENDCYYKSSAIALNGIINLNSGSVKNVPCYGYNMASGLAKNNDMLSFINGGMEFITEHNALSRQIKIGETFNEFGRTWKIDNIYYKDGILHLITEIYADTSPQESLSIVIDGLVNDTYAPGDMLKLETTLYCNKSNTTGTVTWTSSDTSIATIDGEGNITFVADGKVRFTAYWKEKNYSTTSKEVTVISSEMEIGEEISYSISGGTEIKCGATKTYKAIITNAESEAINALSVEWNVIFDYAVTKTIDGYSIKLLISDERAIEEILTLQLLVDGEVKAELKIKVKSLW